MSMRTTIGRWLLGADAPAAAPEAAPAGIQNGAGIQNAADIPLPAIRRGTDIYEVFAGSSPMQGIPVVTERSALTISTVWACVSLISGAISTLPMHLYDRKGDGERTRRENDPLWWTLNEEFCPRWVASAAWEWLVMSRLFHGDAFAEIQRTGARVTGIIPLHPLRTEPVPWSDGSRLAYIVWPEPGVGPQEIRVLDQDDVLHVPSLGFDGTRSLSPLRYALQVAGGVSLAMQDYSGQFFANQARPDYALVAPQEKRFDKEQIEHLRAQIDEKHAQRNGQGGKPMLLTGGMDIKTITMPNRDAELLTSRGFQVQEIARVYGVPPFMVGHNEKTTSWGSGVAEMGTGFVRYVLRRHLIAFQNEINRKLFRTASRVAEFDTFELERADLKTLFETFRSALGRAGEQGFMTRDEVRGLINFGKTEGGDTFNEAKSSEGQTNKGQANAQPAA
ncbi:phage portal protein [Sphingobium sp. H39-3-25]|uniref:phage portal protein n=1 Tax=Sphingobium arseniciresistens TaxID=3030834 RepID=UPI0023B8F833|nr:phage portal protein [Sphingobium arseniciresistens]